MILATTMDRSAASRWRMRCSWWRFCSRSNMAAALNQKAFERKLQGMSSTQDSVQTVSLWMIHHKKHAADMVRLWLDQLKKGKPCAKCGPDRRLKFRPYLPYVTSLILCVLTLRRNVRILLCLQLSPIGDWSTFILPMTCCKTVERKGRSGTTLSTSRCEKRLRCWGTKFTRLFTFCCILSVTLPAEIQNIIHHFNRQWSENQEQRRTSDQNLGRTQSVRQGLSGKPALETR